MLYLYVKFWFFPSEVKAFLYFKFEKRFDGIDNFKTIIWRSVIFAVRIFI